MKTIMLKITELKQHPFHKKLYSLRNIESLAESIEKSGLLEPIVINQKKMVISGWRRVLAKKYLKAKTIDAIYSDTMPPEQEARLIIDYNKQRIKTITEKWGEIQELRKNWGKKQGERTDMNSKLSTEEKKHTKDRIASALGISAGNVYKIERIATKDSYLLTLIDTGEISIHEAYNRCSEEVVETDDKPAYKPSKSKSGVIAHSKSTPMPLQKLYAHTCPHCGEKFND